MSSKLTVCGVCEYRNINNSSVVWCSECNEGLCGECKGHHAASKATRDHSIVPISEYQKLPTNVLEITQTCPKHNEKYVIFCKKHDSPCCRRCVVETHDDCRELIAIDDVIRNVKSSTAFLEMEQILAELSENFQKISKDRQDNISSLKENKTKIEKKIEHTRVLINKHLDKLQESLMKELVAAEEKENKKISRLISSIQVIEREITECQTNLNKIKQHASDLQTFLALKHFQQDVTNKEHFMESLLKEDSMNHVILLFEKEKELEPLFTAINKIGTVILDTRSSDLTLTNRKNKQAQIMVPITHIPTIDDLKLTLIQTVNTNLEDNSDCSLLADGRMIFLDITNRKIIVLKPDGSLDAQFSHYTESYISHIHPIEDSQNLVLSYGSEKAIRIIDMENRTEKDDLSVESDIYGIFYKDAKLFFNGFERGLCVVSLDGGSVTQLTNAMLPQFSGITIWSDQLYYVDTQVTCCDLQGTIKWKLNQAFYPRDQSIQVDNYGRVYVVEGNSVVVISPDGNKHRVLLSEKDSLQNPTTLFFDRKNNKLLISNQSNVAFLYDVSN